MILSNPLKIPTTLLAGFGGATLSHWHCERVRDRRRCRRQTVESLSLRSPTRTVPLEHSVLLSGRLSTAHGQPLGRVPLRIVERFDGGIPAPRESTVWAEANGSFVAPLSTGPSREIVAVFAGSPTLTRASSGPLQLAVRSRVTLQASATEARVGGPPLVFRGRIAAEPGTIPPAGKSVELQFRLPGLPWSEFRTVQTDRRGRFRYAYRFSDDDSRGARFQFRAYAPAQDGWPYEPAGSLPIVIRGR